MKTKRIGSMLIQPSKFQSKLGYGKGYCSLKFADVKSATSFQKALKLQQAVEFDGVYLYEKSTQKADEANGFFDEIILFVRINSNCTKKGMVRQRDAVYELAEKHGAYLGTHWTC